MASKGEIQIILGPMFSGKSTELLRRLRKYEYGNKKIALIKYQKDNRYENGNLKREVVTHDGLSREAYPCNKLSEILELTKNADVIGIDEGQFFTDVVDFADDLANIGKIIIIAALDGNFKREPFGDILRLIPKAEKVKKLRAVCTKCAGSNAAFTERTTMDTQEELIGGHEAYVAACRNCHHIRNSINQNNKGVSHVNQTIDVLDTPD